MGLDIGNRSHAAGRGRRSGRLRADAAGGYKTCSNTCVSQDMQLSLGACESYAPIQSYYLQPQGTIGDGRQKKRRAWRVRCCNRGGGRQTDTYLDTDRSLLACLPSCPVCVLDRSQARRRSKTGGPLRRCGVVTAMRPGPATTTCLASSPAPVAGPARRTSASKRPGRAQTTRTAAAFDAPSHIWRPT